MRTNLNFCILKKNTFYFVNYTSSKTGLLSIKFNESLKVCIKSDQNDVWQENMLESLSNTDYLRYHQGPESDYVYCLAVAKKSFYWQGWANVLKGNLSWTNWFSLYFLQMKLIEISFTYFKIYLPLLSCFHQNQGCRMYSGLRMYSENVFWFEWQEVTLKL